MNAWKTKPMAWFRIFARWLALRFSTGSPSSRYLPPVGESSSPRIDSSVVLPHPDGPAMDTNSPLSIPRLMLDRAWVSTSSV